MHCRSTRICLAAWLAVAASACTPEPPVPATSAGAGRAATAPPVPASTASAPPGQAAPLPRSGEQATRTLRLPASLTAAAVNPENGDVAFVSLRSGQLWLLKSAWFEGDASAKLGPVPGVENPSSLAFKRYAGRTFLIVGCFAAGPLRVFAADTLEPLRLSHNRRADAVWVSVAHNPADPFIYVSSRVNGKPEVSVANLAADEFSLHPLQTFGRSPAKIAGAVVSYSGRTLYTFGDDDRRLTAYRVLPPASSHKPPRLEHLFDHPDPAATRTEPPIPLPFDLGLADAGAILSSDPAPLRTPLPDPVQCIDVEQPLGLGLADQQLALVSLAAPRLLARRPLAAELFAYQLHEREIVARVDESAQRFAIRPVVLADSGRNRILVLGNRDVQVLATRDLPRTGEAWLGLELDVPRAIPAGKPWTTRLRKTDPTAEIVLDSAPGGMTLRDDELTWTPPRAALGRAGFVLRLQRDAAVVRHELSMEVTGPALSCPYRADRIAVFPDGTRLVAWTAGWSNARLALIDSATDRVLAERTLPGEIVGLRIAHRALCLATARGADQELLSLHPETLVTLGQAKVSIPEHRRQFGDGLLQLRGADQIVLDKYYSLPELKEIAPPFQLGGSGPSIAGRVEGGWSYDGVIWDDALSTPRALLSPGGFLHVDNTADFWDNAWLRGPAGHSGHFSAQEMAGTQAARTRQRLAAIDLPIDLEVAIRPEGRAGMSRVDVVAYSRVDRRELGRWPIEVIEVEPDRSYAYRLVTDGLAAALTLAGRVYAINLGELQASARSHPLAFVPVQSTLLAAADSPARLAYHVHGGQPPYVIEASLPDVSDATLVRSLAPGSLELELDVPRYTVAQQQPLARLLVDRSPATEAAESIIARYRQGVTTAFRRLTGRDPLGVPLAMPLEVRVLDSGSRSARFHHYLLVDVPPDTFVPPLDVEIANRWKGTTVATAAQARIELRAWQAFVDAALALWVDLQARL